MLVSLNWLNELIDIHDISVDELKNKLTFAGVEVESVNKLSTATNLVVGKVISCESVPDTHLHLCQIDLGNKYGSKQIICGAPNVRKDLKVIVALPGAKLPLGEIKVSTIRGYESNGMCCSLLELGVDEKYVSEADKTGIHELDDSVEVGREDVLKLLGLDDTILNLKLLANRPDLLSIYNVAREVATLFNRELNKYEIKKFNTTPIDFKVSSETNKCPQFSIRVIKGITVKESPDDLKEYLIASGVRPINNIVDIGNYIMLLTGCPVHIYDLDKLPKNELIVKNNYDGDFVALDEKHYQINRGDLVVKSNNEVMCLAGVMGGLNSSDTVTTKNIVIEAANFDGASIRRTSTRLNLASESSNRFVHGINPTLYASVIQIATMFIDTYCGLNEVSEIKTYEYKRHKNLVIKTNAKKINAILGTNYDAAFIAEILNRDHFKTTVTNKKLTINVPKYRIDIDGVNDIAEEVIRLTGFKDVKNELPMLKTAPGLLTINQRKKKDIESYLRNAKLYETLTYVLVNEKLSKGFRYLNKELPYKLINPLTDDHQYVRASLIPSLLDVVSYNLAHQNKDFGVFEISDINVNDKKDLYIGIVLTGDNKYQGELKKYPYSYYTLKGYLEAIMSILGIEKNRYQLKEWLDNASKEMHPTRSACVYIGKDLIGYLGELHPSCYDNYDIKNAKAYVMELNLGALISTPTGSVKFKAIAKFPSVTRDLALVVSKDINADTVINIIKRNGGAFIKEVNVFDVYTDASLLNNSKSIAVKLTLLNENATLKDQEINETIEKIKIALLKENIHLR